MTRHNLTILFTLVLVFIAADFLSAQVVKTEVIKKGKEFQLLRNGSPYYIKGAGGEKHLELLKSVGGNCIRTWGVDNAQEVLDKAQAQGITVMLGMWVQHERHGFDYNDKVAVKKQLDHFRKVVEKHKDHPALLIWAIGNEVDLNYANTKVWDAVQDIAKMVHEVDPNHPTTTVTAGLDKSEVELILAKAPDIDIYSVNTYGDIGNVGKNIAKFGWKGPYMITEWGPNGHWEVGKTKWNVPIEQTSTEKAKVYKDRYVQNIQKYKATCLGSFVFLWGHKQETTSTWYGLFTKNNKPTEAIDELEYVWTGKYPEQRAASIESVTLNKKIPSKGVVVARNEMSNANIKINSSSTYKVKWKVVQESDDIKSGGDAESAPPSIPGLVKSSNKESVRFRAPMKEGAYRLFVEIKTKEGKVSYANIPFWVDGAKEISKSFVFFKSQKIEE